MHALDATGAQAWGMQAVFRKAGDASGRWVYSINHGKKMSEKGHADEQKKRNPVYTYTYENEINRAPRRGGSVSRGRRFKRSRRWLLHRHHDRWPCSPRRPPPAPRGVLSAASRGGAPAPGGVSCPAHRPPPPRESSAGVPSVPRPAAAAGSWGHSFAPWLETRAPGLAASRAA
jgi:hypothetical protein